MTEAEKARKLARYHHQRQAMSAEELDAIRAKKRAYDKAHYRRTIVYQTERHKRDYEAHKEAHKKQSAECRQRMRENPELRARYNAAVKARLNANGGVKGKAAKANQRTWRHKNADSIKARHKEYYRRHYRENYLAYFNATQKRRALERAATVNLLGIRAFVKGVKSKPSAVCYYCQRKVSTAHVHFDHIIALSRGGLHAVENLCVSCSACNMSKGAKPMTEWARTCVPQQLLNL